MSLNEIKSTAFKNIEVREEYFNECLDDIDKSIISYINASLNSGDIDYVYDLLDELSSHVAVVKGFIVDFEDGIRH